MKNPYQIIKVASHCFWIYKNGECLPVTWTSRIAAEKYIATQQNTY